MRVVGSTRVANNMRAAAAASENTLPITKRWGQETRRKLKGKKYPPRRPGQRYRRTGLLANSWRSKVTGKNTISIENEASRRGRPYPVFVIGDRAGKRQAWMHVGRWWIAREVIDDEVPELRRRIQDDIVDKGNGE